MAIDERMGLIVGALLVAGGCSDDDAANDDDGSESSTTDTTDTTVTTTFGTGVEESSDGADGSSTGTVDTTGDGPPTSCTPTALPGPLDAGAWDDRFTIAGLTGRDGYGPIAHDIVEDVDGSLLVAGYLRWGDGQRVDGLARWQDGAWTPPTASWGELDVPQAGFSAVAIGAEGELALASTDLAGQGDGEIWLDTGSGPTTIGQHTGAFRQLAWIDGDLWGAGMFALADGGPQQLAIWDGSTWRGAPGGDPDGPVFAMLREDDGDVIVAGEFTSIGGIAAERVARWTGTAWEPMDMPAAARVLALELDDGGTLLAGGLFLLDDANLPSASLARWTGTGWVLVGGGVAAGEATGVVSDLWFADGTMHVAGCFDRVGGGIDDPNALPAAGIATLQGDTWTPIAEALPVGTPWFSDLACGFEPDPAAVFSIPHQKLHHDGERLWLAGAFAGVDGVASQSIASYEDAAWHPVGAAGLGLSGVVGRLVVGGPACDAFGLAFFTHAGGEPFSAAVARFDAAQGWVEASPPPPEGSCSELGVRSDGELVLGCVVFGGEPDFLVEGAVYRLVDDAWQSIGALPGPVHDLEVAPDDSVWIVGGEATGWLARLVDDEIVIVEEGFDGVVLDVDFVAGTGSEVVVGGAFQHVGNLAAARIARWGSQGWTALGDGLSATPSAIEATSEVVWAGTFDEGTPGRLVLGRFDGTAWTELATPEHGLPAPYGFSSHTFTRLQALDDGLVAVGYVMPETGGRNAYLFDGDQFTVIDGGIAAISVDDVVVTGDALLFGGLIAEVGGGGIVEVGTPPALRPSIGTARFAW